MALFADGISLTFCDNGVRYPAAKKHMANEIPLIFVSGAERLAGATRQIAQWHLCRSSLECGHTQMELECLFTSARFRAIYW
jgi:hypothetical protein